MPIAQHAFVPKANPAKAKLSKAAPTTFPIYLAIVCDGHIPGVNNLLHVTARFGPTLVHSMNIKPQNGVIRKESNLHVDLIKQCAQDAVDIKEAMSSLATWFKRFEGNRVIVGQASAFWHLVYHMSAHVPAPLPFASNPVDIASYQMGATGELKAPTRMARKDPRVLAEERQTAIEKLLGKRPQARPGEFILEWDREYEV